MSETKQTTRDRFILETLPVKRHGMGSGPTYKYVVWDYQTMHTEYFMLEANAKQYLDERNAEVKAELQGGR